MRSSYLTGALLGISAATIWAGWSAVTRLAVTTTLDAWDVTALRFGIAAALLLPVVLRHGIAIGRLGWSGLAAIIAGVGAPYVMLAAGGLRFAPAHDQAALNPGCAPLFVALIAALWLRERPRFACTIGLGLASSNGRTRTGLSPSRRAKATICERAANLLRGSHRQRMLVKPFSCY